MLARVGALYQPRSELGNAIRTIWRQWLEPLYYLRRDNSGSHKRPHKPALLLAILDLVDKGRVTRKQIPLNEDLIKTFRLCFDIVRQRDDKPSLKVHSTFSPATASGHWQDQGEDQPRE